MADWIKCSERMPDHGVAVLIAGTHIDHDADPATNPDWPLDVSCYYWDGKEWRPTGTFDEPCTLHPWYWMPTPDLPTR